MNDKISYNSADLEAAASELDRVSEAIRQAAGILSRVDTSQEWWRKVNVPGSIHLKGTETTVHFGAASASLRALKSAADRYGSHAGTLANATRQAIRLFDDAERENLKTLIGGEARSNTVFNGVNSGTADFSGVLGFPQDRSKWTDSMKKQYDEFVDSLTQGTLEDGTTVFTKEGMVIVMDADGRVKETYESSAGFADRSETYTSYTYDADGNLVSTHKESESFDGTTVTDTTYDADGKEIHTKTHEKDSLFGTTITDTEIGDHDSRKETTKQFFTLDQTGYERKKFDHTFTGKDGKKHTIKPVEQTDLGPHKVTQYDSKTKKWTDATKEKDGSYSKKLVETKRVATIAEMTLAGVSTESAYMSGTVSGESGIFSGELTAGVSTGEAHANVKAGLYSTKISADGTTSYAFEPGVSAEAGASYSVLKVEGSGQIGGDNFNAFGEGSIDVGSAETKAGIQLGIVDGKIAAGGSVSAEVNLVKAEGDVGVNFGGVKGSVGGSVEVGIGAHAKAGIYDGVLTVDIGASFGVGASVRFNLDISGAVNKAAGVLESGAKFCKKLFSLF